MSQKQAKKRRLAARNTYEWHVYLWMAEKPPKWRIFRYLKWKKRKPVKPRICRDMGKRVENNG